MNLRDHDQPCGHDRWCHQTDKGWMCGEIDCPGGRVPTRQELIDMLPFKVEIDYVVTKVWGPGDTYQTIRDRQVFDIPTGTRMRRWVSEWEPVDAALGDGE